MLELIIIHFSQPPVTSSFLGSLFDSGPTFQTSFSSKCCSRHWIKTPETFLCLPVVRRRSAGVDYTDRANFHSYSATCSWIGMFRRTTELSEKLLHYPHNRCEFIDLKGVIIQGVYVWAKCFRSGRGKWIKKMRKLSWAIACVLILPMSCSVWRMTFVCFFWIFLSIIDLCHVSLLFRAVTPVSLSTWSHVPKHILSLVARTLRSWVRVYTGERVFFLCLCCTLYKGTSL